MKRIIGTFIGLMIVAFAGCSQKTAVADVFAVKESAPMEADCAGAPRVAMSKKMMTANYSGNSFSEEAEGSGAQDESGYERKLIRNGSVSIFTSMPFTSTTTFSSERLMASLWS